MQWNENEHPRDDDGKFTEKNGVVGTRAEIKKLKELGIDLKPLTKKGIIELPKEEYGQLCHEVYTWFTNKIPENGGIFINNNYYRFSYSKSQSKIVCNLKLDIDKYSQEINILEELYNETKK